jgi:hypothetical protein
MTTTEMVAAAMVMMEKAVADGGNDSGRDGIFEGMLVCK